jgi:hypothetical protein
MITLKFFGVFCFYQLSLAIFTKISKNGENQLANNKGIRGYNF